MDHVRGGFVVHKTISVRLWSVQLSKWELGFIKNDMATQYDFTRGQIIALVTTMIRWVPQKDTRGGTGLKFVYGSRGK